MIQAILFDKDGTLLYLGDTWDQPTIDAFHQVMGHSDWTAEQIREYGAQIGISDNGLIPNSLFAAGSIGEQAAELAQHVPLSEKQVHDLLEDVFLSYVRQMDVSEALVEGAHEVLAQLSQDYRIGLVTNDNRRLTEEMLRQCDLLSYFDFIACADEYGPKPNPASLHAFRDKFGIDLKDMIYVGDSTVDMIFSQYTRAGIGVAFSPEDRDYVQDADFIIDDLRKIPSVLNEINQLER